MVSSGQASLVKVDLHCHSDVSDGYYAPAVLADLLAENGVSFAALTDHWSIAGLEAFRSAAALRGISVISGTELHAVFEETEVHLLAYGFDPEHPQLAGLLARAANGLQSREQGKSIDAAEAIALVHEAGGLLFLAHPLQTGWSATEMEQALELLAALGLDGIEVFYKSYTGEDRQKLAALADRFGILASGGSDFHGPVRDGEPGPGTSMPAWQWKRFREALNAGPGNGMYGSLGQHHTGQEPPLYPGHIDWNWLALRIILPSLLVVAFFMGLIFAILIPGMEERLMDRKREMTTELTNSAWSILADYHREVQEGSLSLKEAKESAVERIRRLRYGPQGKNYFWLTDMHPRMVMHPYRSDLEESDLRDFTDPDGVRPFMEFVAAVQNGDSGYVSYVWQWQDNPDRLEAKESHVRRFQPWDWIIGTGLYVDDVRQEIRAITARMIDLSFIVLVMVIALLVMVAYQSLKVERRRGAAELELRESHERYRALIESAGSGSLLVVDGRCAYANPILLDMAGYTPSELAFIGLEELLCEGKPGAKSDCPLLLDAEDGASEPFEARLTTRNGVTVPVLVSSTPVFLAGREGLVLNIQDLSRYKAGQSAESRDRLLAQMQSSLLFLTEPVKNSMIEPLCCGLETSIAQAVRLMCREQSDAVAVTGPSDELLGIVTDQDIRQRVVAAGLDTGAPLSSIMSAPVVGIDEHAPVFEASLLERENDINHLAVTDASGRLVGMVQSSRTVRPDSYSLAVLTQKIRRADSVDELCECYQRLPVLIASLFETGALPRNICTLATTVSDGIARRVLSLSIDTAGRPPAAFAFVALGSEAREEQTLATDQDNALVYITPEHSAGEESRTADGAAAEYFLGLGELVCQSLDRIGYHYCKGGVMARNPQWNQSLERWKGYFRDWIEEPDDTALSQVNIFFDYRTIYGDHALVRNLGESIAEEVGRNHAFLPHMALNTLSYKVPLGLFGTIATGSAGDQPHTFNIKDAMMPIVCFARLHALRYGLEQTNTLDRLDAIAQLGELSQESHRAISQAYGHLMQLRYRHQTERIAAGLDPDNAIDPRDLSPIELGTLKTTLSQIAAIQKRVGYEFSGTG